MPSLRHELRDEVEESDIDPTPDMDLVELGTCSLCHYAIYEPDLANTARGPMHVSCGDDHFSTDHGASVWPE